MSRFLSEGIVLCVTVDSMHLWEEVSSGASCVAILDCRTILFPFKTFS